MKKFGFLRFASTFYRVIASPVKASELQDRISSSFLPGSEKPKIIIGHQVPGLRDALVYRNNVLVLKY